MSKRTMNSIPQSSLNAAHAGHKSQPKLIAEDGWIFVERPGLGVKCIRRYDAMEAATLQQPYAPRHDYPSN